MHDDSPYLLKAKALLQDVKHKQLCVEERREQAIELAEHLLQESRRIASSYEHRQQEEMGRMMRDLSGKAFAVASADQCFRTKDHKRIADQLLYLVKRYGVPHFLNLRKSLPLTALKWMGKTAASFLVPAVKRAIRKETKGVILPEETEKLLKHIAHRKKAKMETNLNYLGEAVLGEEEAKRRLDKYLDALSQPEIGCISVKVSTLCSQVYLNAWEETLGILVPRLQKLYRAALQHTYVNAKGRRTPKMVHLDMEEYSGMHLTAELFQRALEPPEFFHYKGGIALQSYLPDSYLLQQKLTIWAMQRVASGGAPIRIRLVKGANLNMERVEASLANWPQAPYDKKCTVDANFKRMLHYACDPTHAEAAEIGVGSHNLFDIAYTLLLRAENGLENQVGFEMLEGMASPMSRTVQKLSGQMLLYCPTTSKEEFPNAIAYLTRRLDENTAPQNFLRHAFDLLPRTKEWHNQANHFSLSCHTIDALDSKPRRTQNYFTEPQKHLLETPFGNEPETDWSLPMNRKWAGEIAREWEHKLLPPVPLGIAGNLFPPTEENTHTGSSPSLPEKALYSYASANSAHVEQALACAQETEEEWQRTAIEERVLLLSEVAHQLRCQRTSLVGAMMADTGKTMVQADLEVNEAIDFAEYYARSVLQLATMEGVHWKSKGTILVCPPWNFPLAIPAGSILSALVTGNCVLFKPAPEAIFVGFCLAELIWKAGVSRSVLQFLPCEEDPVGTKLIQDERIHTVMLTGSTETAKKFLQMRPCLDLIAETGGKNSLIITRLADRDLAIKDLIHSAFSHSGQKCSACSLAICEKEVYEDPHFRAQLKDATRSLPVGTPWSLDTQVGPLIHAPNEALLKGLTTLEEGEEWLLKPEPSTENPHLWSPGVKLGVQKGSFTHQTEFFGPVLGLMCAENLSDAIEIANSTPYGLTAGLHSLDPREQEKWKEKICAGNCYINRGITGAIVQRQPFGGTKASCFGKGYKAGGPNTLIQLMTPTITITEEEGDTLPSNIAVLTTEIETEERNLWRQSVVSYAESFQQFFLKPEDKSHCLGETNFLHYVPRGTIVLRLQEEERLVDPLRAIAAALICAAPLEISGSKTALAKLHSIAALKKESFLSFVTEDTEAFLKRVQNQPEANIRFLSPPGPELLDALADKGCHYLFSPILANGRLELLHYLREVAVATTIHRYGHEVETDEPQPRTAHSST